MDTSEFIHVGALLKELRRAYTAVAGHAADDAAESVLRALAFDVRMRDPAVDFAIWQRVLAEFGKRDT